MPVALGAQRSTVLRMVLAEGLTLMGVGIITGMSISLGVTRLMRGLLYGVAPNDPLTLLGVTFALLVVGMAACVIPACRAMQVDPAVALRYE